MVLFYRNSFWASLVSIFGSVFGISGIMMIVEGEVVGGIVMIVLAIPMLIWAKSISEQKSFKKWWKAVADAGLEPQIAQSASVALQIYQKNPCELTLKKIAQLNPAAAESIRQQLTKK